MGLLRKLKKLTNELRNIDDRPPVGRRHFPPPPPPPPPPPRSADLVYGPLPESFFDAVNAAREGSGYDPLPIFNRKNSKSFNQARKNVSSPPPADRRRLPPGTPIKYRRRPVSPDLLRPRSSSASSLFAHSHSVPGSPPMHHRFGFDPMVQQGFPHPWAQSMPFFPNFHQPLHPMIHPHVQMAAPGWFVRSPPAVFAPAQAFHQFF